MSAARPERHRPAVEQLHVGNDTAAPAAEPVQAPAADIRRKRPPFSSYLDPDLQKEFKIRCVVLDIEMQDGLAGAIREWLERHPAP
ncbi:hypothetical protein [Actinacidiphila soli]|uniref:hypothetical protein n=1 Tax=Actinacidiphila soli TaxID=2487275 RepID=UPI000FCA55CD|nr:hypothetical protein [Actinacidiphila soli]